MLAGQAIKEFVQVDQIGALAVYLASDSAKTITGAIIPIDGGWTAH
jgi:3-hydroxybutyrate dehydrogenase